MGNTDSKIPKKTDISKAVINLIDFNKKIETEFRGDAKIKRHKTRHQQRIDKKDRENHNKRIAAEFAHRENNPVKLKL